MPPKRNTAHLNRANGRTACGRARGIFTPNVLYVHAFKLAILDKKQKVCTYCKRAYLRLPTSSK